MLTPDNTPSPSPTKVSDPDHEIISFHKMRMSPGACHRVGLGKATQAILRERSTAHDPDHAFVCSLFFFCAGEAAYQVCRIINGSNFPFLSSLSPEMTVTSRLENLCVSFCPPLVLSVCAAHRDWKVSCELDGLSLGFFLAVRHPFSHVIRFP